MASAMSDLFTVSFVAASLVLRISVRGRDRRNATATGADSQCQLDRRYRPRFSLVWPAAEADQGAEQSCKHQAELGSRRGTSAF
jgi:hypothetical protein